MPNGQSVVPSGGGAAGTKVFEAINWLKGLGGIGFAKAGQEISKEKYKGRSALDAFLELVPGAFEGGLEAISDIAGRQSKGRVAGAIPLGILGWLAGGPAGAAAGAYFGSRWGQQLGRKAKRGVGEATRMFKEVGDVPKTMFGTGGSAARIKIEELLNQLKGGVRAGREAVGGRATEDALTALLLAGGGKKLKDIAFGEGELSTLFEKPEGKIPDFFQDLYHGGKAVNLGEGTMGISGGIKGVPTDIGQFLKGAGADVTESVRGGIRGGRNTLLDLMRGVGGESYEDVFKATVGGPGGPGGRQSIGDILRGGWESLRDAPSELDPSMGLGEDLEQQIRWILNLGGRR